MFAILGAVATVVLSFLPVSPTVGGTLAGYFERSESDRTVSVGTLAGLLPMLPVLSIAVFILGGLVAGLLAIDQVGSAFVAGATLFFTFMFVGTVSTVSARSAATSAAGSQNVELLPTDA